MAMISIYSDFDRIIIIFSDLKNILIASFRLFYSNFKSGGVILFVNSGELFSPTRMNLSLN